MGVGVMALGSRRARRRGWQALVVNWQKHGKVVPFEQVAKRELDHSSREFIEVLVECGDPQGRCQTLVPRQGGVPVLHDLRREHDTSGYYAATLSNDKIDLNAQADRDLMTHLLRADALVSNETGLLRNAFNDIWRPRRKVLFTSQEFADFIKKVV